MTLPFVCLPFAGAGASFFAPWATRLAASFDVLPVRLPGREQRYFETPLVTVSAAVDDAMRVLRPRLAGRRDVVLFGHSLGAVLAYELALQARRTGAFGVARLVVSGAPGPMLSCDHGVSPLPDDDFVAEVRALVGYSHAALDHAELRQAFLPALRADVTMHEGYVPARLERLDMPITCVRGRRDDLVSAEAAARWQEVTSLPLDFCHVHGGHMYLLDAPDELFALLEGPMAAHAEPSLTIAGEL